MQPTDGLILEISPSCRFHLAVDVPGLRRGGSSSQPVNQAQDVGEQPSRDCDLGELERDIATVAPDLGADLDQLLAERLQ